MRFDMRSFILFCLYVFQCNAGSPEEGFTKAKPAPRYTSEEDDFIIEEITRLPVDRQKLHSRSLWESMSGKIREKMNENPNGFPHERTHEGLRTRFKLIVSGRRPELTKKVPEALLEKFRLDLNKSPRGARRPYTPEEEAFIVNELSKISSSCANNELALKTLDVIRVKHDEKRAAGDHGFHNDRTVKSLRSHIVTMEQNGQLPQEVVKKFWKLETGASSSGSTSANRQTILQEMNEEDEED